MVRGDWFPSLKIWIKKGTPLLQRPWVPLFIYRTNFGKELFCFSFSNQIHWGEASEIITNQRSSSLFPNGLYLISKTKVTAMLKSNSPKMTWGGGIIIRPLYKRHKKTALFCWGGLLQRPDASVSLFPLRRISNSSPPKLKWVCKRWNP